MSALRFRLLGVPQVVASRSGNPAESPAEVRLTRQLQALLAYLLLYRERSHPRDVLIDLFWGDEPGGRGRSCLTTALWRLRRALASSGPTDATFIESSGHDVQIDRQLVYVLDVAELEASASTALTRPVDRVGAPAIAALREAVGLYRGDLLEGFYDDWVLRERERLRLLYHRCLLYLLQYHRARAAWAEALVYGELLIEHDPLREDVHREVMRLYVRTGQRTLAIRQYAACREILARELEIAPMEETELLYAEILAGSAPGLRAGPEPGSDRPIDLEFVLERANAAKRTLEASVEELTRLIHALETAPDGPSPAVTPLVARRPRSA